ncbi:LacI family DNA-binding transcriptional regulator [Kribbella sp. NPDC004536]|uniref:LacI family DNA-binding transcriptional regulator n=1 Tax=Kribbella sp. NPDC004536 TaxID=3364106 RepID=UPI0036A9AB62
MLPTSHLPVEPSTERRSAVSPRPTTALQIPFSDTSGSPLDRSGLHSGDSILSHWTAGMPAASIKEVARRAGVSVGTVSNFLSRPGSSRRRRASGCGTRTRSSSIWARARSRSRTGMARS